MAELAVHYDQDRGVVVVLRGEGLPVHLRLCDCAAEVCSSITIDQVALSSVYQPVHIVCVGVSYSEDHRFVSLIVMQD